MARLTGANDDYDPRWDDDDDEGRDHGADDSDGGSIAEMVGYHCDGPHDAAGPYFKISIRFL